MIYFDTTFHTHISLDIVIKLKAKHGFPRAVIHFILKKDYRHI